MEPRMSPLREDPAYVVTVLVQVVDRHTRVSLHDEQAVVLFARRREYLGGVRLTDYDDHDGIAFYVKQQMLSIAYARDSMSYRSPVLELRQKMLDRKTYFDAVVLDTKEISSYDWLKKFPERWKCPDAGCIFDGIVNPY